MADPSVVDDRGETCRDCGRKVASCVGSYWNAPNDLWNTVWGDEGGILCPACFVTRAEALGFCVAFRAFEYAPRRSDA